MNSSIIYDNICSIIHKKQGSGRENRWLVKDNRSSLRNNRLKLETLGELLNILEVSMKYTSNEWKQNQKMSSM